MKSPDFWWGERGGVLDVALSPLSFLYGAVANRPFGKGEKAALPVICVGNFTAGGAGKTPFCLALADALIDAGRKPAFLSRGHGGSTSGPLFVDPAQHTAQDVGDEPLLLVQQAPTCIARDRVAGAAFISESGLADIIIMDDGFQSAALLPSEAILLVDGNRGVGNGRVMPAGPLRASLETQLAHTSRIIVVGGGTKPHTSLHVLRTRAEMKAIPVHDAAFEVVSAPQGGRKYIAYCGIGNPNKFFQSLKDAKLNVVATRAFADHEEISDADAAVILKQAAALDAVPINTTKDRARMMGRTGEVGKLAAASATLEVKLKVDGLKELAVKLAKL